ncbi:MAG: rod shape-determining protein MreC [Alphaproteobacteria bacterium]|nr:rod shape-determining protein MreC [Alphaproteobacteria bacterium]
MANGTWRIARTRGGAHLPLIIVAALAVALILIGKAQSSLFDRARAHVMDWMAPALEASRTPVDVASRWVGSIGEIFTVYQENLRLKEENARLRQWHSTAITLDDRLKRYQLLLHAVPDPALSSVTARVIGRASHPFLQTMILDAGKQNGVKPGQAVVDARGMIGRIFLAGERTSWVILLTDLNSRIPVTIEPGSTHAIIAGDNSSAPVIDTFTQGKQLNVGDQVVSSGDGGLLPAGLPIGTVVADGSDYRVALFADLSTAQDVEILDFKQPPEQPPAPTPSDLPVTAAGLPPAAPPPQTDTTPIVPQGATPGAPVPAKLVPKPAPIKPSAVKKGQGASLNASRPAIDNNAVGNGVE